MDRYGDVEGFVDRYLFVDFLFDRTGPKKRVNKHCRTCRTLVLVKIHKKIHSARCYYDATENDQSGSGRARDPATS